MLVLTRKTRESVVIGRSENMQVMLEITVLEIEGGRVRLGFEADTRIPIHCREVWNRICTGGVDPDGKSNDVAVAASRTRLASDDGNGDGEAGPHR